MYFKKLWKGFALLLVVCILAAGAGPFVSRADEVSDLKQSIADKQEAISEANELKKQIGANIAAYRKRAGMTQMGLAEKLNYSDKAISKWERCECYPPITLLPDLAVLLSCSVNDFFVA